MKDQNDNNRETRIKRIIYQSWHRGCKETDTILGKFAKKYIETFSDKQLDQYEAFIGEDDWDIYAWLTGKLPFPKEHENEVTEMIRNFDFSQEI